MNLSEHFSLEECEHTEQDLPNELPDSLVNNATHLAEDILEPLRVLLGPLHINSWYRSPAVNSAVGGEEKSYHLDALAADVVPNGDCFSAFKMVVTQLDSLPIDKVIFEHRNSDWLHIQAAQPGRVPRKQALTAKPNPGASHGMCYELYPVV